MTNHLNRLVFVAKSVLDGLVPGLNMVATIHVPWRFVRNPGGAAGSQGMVVLAGQTATWFSGWWNGQHQQFACAGVLMPLEFLFTA